MFVLPCLMVFFLCPCGSIYEPNAPHGRRELSALVDGIGTAVVTPIVAPLVSGVVGVGSTSDKIKAGSVRLEEKVEAKAAHGEGVSEGKEAYAKPSRFPRGTLLK
jgi:hypothetical protein